MGSSVQGSNLPEIHTLFWKRHSGSIPGLPEGVSALSPAQWDTLAGSKGEYPLYPSVLGASTVPWGTEMEMIKANWIWVLPSGGKDSCVGMEAGDSS